MIVVLSSVPISIPLFLFPTFRPPLMLVGAADGPWGRNVDVMHWPHRTFCMLSVVLLVTALLVACPSVARGMGGQVPVVPEKNLWTDHAEVSNGIVQALFDAGLTPGTLSHVEPVGRLNVLFGEIECAGNDVDAVETIHRPSLALQNVDSAKYYTVIALDPDAPDRRTKSLSEWIYMFVIDAQGARVQTGEVVAPWEMTPPRPGTGKHRYLFLVLEQPDGPYTQGEPPKGLPSDRGHFRIRRYIANNRLQAVGATFCYVMSSG